MNTIGMLGLDFIEFVSPQPEKLDALFKEFGFSKTMTHTERAIDLYEQNEIRLLLNKDVEGFGHQFGKLHGPSICSMGWRFANAERALSVAQQRANKTLRLKSDLNVNGKEVPVISGIGDSRIYFMEGSLVERSHAIAMGFVPHSNPEVVPNKGFTRIDHLTNNVECGTMNGWANFYKTIFGFTEVRYFDIRGMHTGLQSYALRSPCGTFCIPINEGTEEKSQINEYLREYNGPGIQHLAFLTEDIIKSLDALSGTSIETLDIDDDYYKEVFNRVPNVTEDRTQIREHKILVDGDDDGYLLQIFTKNIIGPIFIEIIQRKNHHSFGEGNFSALFRSIERDQKKRGVV